MSKVISPRELVMNRLMRRVRAFPDLDIAPLATDDLPARDAALAWAIDQAVSRRWLSLVAVLQVNLSRSWDRMEPGASAALLAGAAQLLLMDRLPAYAVISEAVEWTKRRVRPKAGGLVNAVLRRTAEMIERATILEATGEQREFSQREFPLEDGRVIVFDRDVFAEDALERVAQQTSHTPTLLMKWRERFGEQRMEELALHSIIVPPTIVTGVPPEAESIQRDDGQPMLTPNAQPGFFVFDGSHADLTALLATSAACRVQDPTSAKAVELLRGMSPKRIIDLCAGRGTKTRQLAAMFPNAKIVASDVSQERIKVLGHVFDGNEQVKVAQPAELDKVAGAADIVLADVPCSNTGVLARRGEAKYRFDEARQRELIKMQTTILNRARTLLAPNGVIAYATCSVENEENEAQVRASTERHAMQLVKEVRTFPHGLPGGDAAAYHDGGYAAILAPRGTGPV